MEFYDVVNSRKTVRDLTDEAILDDVLKRIISAAFKAPTNDHLRDWHFIIVTDKKVAAKLLELIPKGISPEDMDALIKDWDLNDHLQQECYRSAVPKQYRMLFCASAIIIPLLKEKTDILHPGNVSHLNGFASIWCSIENLFLAATAEGYGCNLRIPLGNEAEHAKEVLGFPDGYFMPCFIGIGKPSDENAPIKQKEIDIDERIHLNRF
ncbi:MAG: nitroreductase family protein [Oscillospiraceae bacterium]|nr:nitroreductase family protein [Oscillospiraceae bacterium]